MKCLFFDSETTGVDANIHGIHQLSGKIIIDGVEIDEFDFKIQPHYGCQYDPKALAVCGVTEAQIKAYPHMHTVFPLILAKLAKHIDMDDPQDKFFMFGYNVTFDARHLLNWFRLNNGNKHFFNLFWTTPIDVMVLAVHYLMSKRHVMKDFKQGTVAEFLGIEVDKSKLHNSLYDLDILIQIYNYISGKY